MIGLILLIVAAGLVVIDMTARPPRFPFLTQVAVLLVIIALAIGIDHLPLH